MKTNILSRLLSAFAAQSCVIPNSAFRIGATLNYATDSLEADRDGKMTAFTERTNVQ